MCKQSGVFQSNVEIVSHRLRWATGDPHGELEAIISSNAHNLERANPSDKKFFDRIIAADCMFFEEFHEDLVWILCAALAPGGVIYMLQPRRGRTMQGFIDKAMQFFDITLSESYDDKVLTSHHDMSFLSVVSKFQLLT